jgi:hypothetical protein
MVTVCIRRSRHDTQVMVHLFLGRHRGQSADLLLRQSLVLPLDAAREDE